MNKRERFYKRAQRIADDYIAMSEELEETRVAYEDMALTIRRLNKTRPGKSDKAMVERVAEALFYTMWVNIKWEDKGKFVRECRDDARKKARVAINAMLGVKP